MAKVMYPGIPLVFLLSLIAICNALEFMDESPNYEMAGPHYGSYVDDDGDGDGEVDLDSAELPLDPSYKRDTVANFNSGKVDPNFKHLWEKVPLHKVEVIKK